MINQLPIVEAVGINILFPKIFFHPQTMVVNLKSVRHTNQSCHTLSRAKLVTKMHFMCHHVRSPHFALVFLNLH